MEVSFVLAISTGLVGLAIGYVVGNNAAKSVIGDLRAERVKLVGVYEDLLAGADMAHERLLGEVDELRAKLSRKKVKPAE